MQARSQLNLPIPVKASRLRTSKRFGIHFSQLSRKEKAPGWAWQSAGGLSKSMVGPSKFSVSPDTARRYEWFFQRPAMEQQSKSKMSKLLGKILIVDDEVELKNILVEALAAQGYEAVGFTSGDEGLAALRAEAFDVLLTDLMMPGMDGIALVGEALKVDPHVVAIVMTGQGTIQTAVDAMKAGTFDYVLKPFRLDRKSTRLNSSHTDI